LAKRFFDLVSAVTLRDGVVKLKLHGLYRPTRTCVSPSDAILLVLVCMP